VITRELTRTACDLIDVAENGEVYAAGIVKLTTAWNNLRGR
jgi:hypothetical protein